jgi:hypothetical protein
MRQCCFRHRESHDRFPTPELVPWLLLDACPGTVTTSVALLLPLLPEHSMPMQHAPSLHVPLFCLTVWEDFVQIFSACGGLRNFSTKETHNPTGDRVLRHCKHQDNLDGNYL